MKSDPGTYALILQCDSKVSAQIGHWGQIEILPGYYLYAGSAFGPGGMRARASRHLRTDKPMQLNCSYQPPR